MKVGIDTFGTEHGRSGLGSYLISLVRNLPESDDISYELFGPELDRFTFNGDRDFPFVSVATLDTYKSDLRWHKLKANYFGKKQQYDVILYAAGSRMIPDRFKVKGVAVVNDIVSTILTQTEGFSSRHQIRAGLSHADCIIASSQYVKKDLERLKIHCKRIEVIHNGVDNTLFYPRANEEVESDLVDIKPFAIKKPYFLYPSSINNPGKRHLELIKAFTLFKEKTGLPHRLVIAGNPSQKYGDLVHKAVFESSAASDIFITGYFPHENFPELYRNAEACLFPSVNEGAGLPVLEAMASGIPVACASAGALPEVAGKNALYFDSSNIQEMADAIERIVSDGALRLRLIKDGLEWEKRFSWEKNARSTIAVLESVLK
ncbi:MAG: glycosyltransferase family 4 protein [Treponema sp.]|nr:glycosyltransferase family 4 protein [Treponema sp.]